VRRFVIIALALVVAPGARAQCPNGTPPPCGGVRAIATTPASNSVAVLYFDSRDTADTFLAEGLSEEIATSLGHVPRLVVKIPSAVRRVQRANEGDVRAIGRALAVRWVVDGSVRRNGTQLRVSVRLVDAERETVTWSNAFTPATTNLLTIQEDIAREVATGIVGALTPTERATVTARPTTNPAAFEHYLKGNWYLGRRGQWLARAVEEYQTAVKLDAAFDEPRAGLALANVSTIDYGGPAAPLVEGGREGVIALADSVIQRNPSIGMAWIARGVALGGTPIGRYSAARASLERAVSLDPNSVEAHFRLGQVFFRVGDYAAARVSLLRALALDPARPVTYELLGVVAYFQRRAPDALRLLDSALVLDPQFLLAMSWDVVVLYSVGDTAKVRVLLKARMPLAEATVTEMQKPALISATTVRDTVAGITMVAHLFPQAWALVGDFEQSLSTLGTPRFPSCRHYVNDPAFDQVRRDLRFREYEKACLSLKESNGGF
jgi:TolB-like protein/tetratricopeptide (TPR) repeat protein